MLDEAHREHRERYPELNGSLRGTLDPVIHFLLARRGGPAPVRVAVGCCAVQPLVTPEVKPEAYELKRMYVTPAARNTGIGRALLQGAEALSVRLGARWLYLETGVRHLDAIRLYERAGYLRVAPYAPYLDDPLALCYAKSLAPQGV